MNFHELSELTLSVQHNEWKKTNFKEHHGAMSGHQKEENIPQVFRQKKKVIYKKSGIGMEFNSATKQIAIRKGGTNDPRTGLQHRRGPGYSQHGDGGKS